MKTLATLRRLRRRIPQHRRYTQPAGSPDALNAIVHTPKHAQPATPTGPLHAWTVSLKSNLSCTQTPTTCGSPVLQQYTAPGDSTVWRLLQQAGARLVGASNMDEFGMGAHTRDSVHGRTRNPWDAQRSAGGSSGGAAAAVARGVCRVAVGSDTGGSVRLPAAWCGVVGYKPSYGLISRAGLVAYGSSLDTVGLLARTPCDVRSVLSILAHPDTRDMTCMPADLRQRIARLCGERNARRGARGLRVGVAQETWVHELSPASLRAWRRACSALREMGCSVERVTLPHVRDALPAYYTVALAEAASNLARFDGVRYGEGRGVLGKEAARRVLLGGYVALAEASQGFLRPAQRVRRLVQRDFDRVFALPNALLHGGGWDSGEDGVDLLLLPTAVGAAPEVGRELAAEMACRAAGYVDDVMTVPANLAGIPAVSVPFGSDRGMPLGLQLMAQYGDDDLLLDMAERLANAAD
ncbi:Trimeric GatFAB AmidoTransferase(AdT) complex subunit [Coemansia sp. RSA 2607]|nr:Trimeric GatFAB AmidoTransferase(AdT) complex subunit [Coemansia sp. RSA 2607]